MKPRDMLLIVLLAGLLSWAVYVESETQTIIHVKIVETKLLWPAVVITSHPGGDGSGSATPLYDRNGWAWYLTAKHCLPVATVGGQEVVHSYPHSTEDVALLQVRGSVGIGSIIADTQPMLGTRLIAMGYGAGEPLQITDGRQGGKPKSMTCPIIFGASGGAVLNERRELVGIIMSVIVRSRGWSEVPIPHVSFYTPIVALKPWINSKVGI